jgi:hypothetical protein
MNPRYIWLILILALAGTLHAQTRILTGVSVSGEYGNISVGPVISMEAPVTKHLEISALDAFYPIEQHIALGHGWANRLKSGMIVWATPSLGVNGSVELSQYHTSINKKAGYVFGGITYRTVGWVPTRLTIDYVRQFANGISKDGTESAHLQGVLFNVDMRMGCTGPMCFRFAPEMQIGRVLTQSNPVCDGTFGVTGGPNGGPCPRTPSIGGGFGITLSVEFPRRRDTEDNPF